MSEFIKLTVIEHQGHTVTRRIDRFFNAAFFVNWEQSEELRGHFPRHTSIAIDHGGHVNVVEEAGWIAQELGCKGRD